MKKLIPEQIEITCDLCKSEDNEINFKHKAQILVTGVALDYLGQPASSIRNQYDLCDDCYGKIANFINEMRKNGQLQSRNEGSG